MIDTVSNKNSTTHMRDLPFNKQVFKWYQHFSKTLTNNNQRAAIHCSGSREWCLSFIAYIQLDSSCVYLSNQLDLSNAIPFHKAESLLGSEVNCVVFDLFSGLNIDVFCMASGLIKAGGTLLILSPNQRFLERDPYGSWQDDIDQNRFFADYFLAKMTTSNAVIKIEEEKPLPEIISLPQSHITPIINGHTSQQTQLLSEFHSWLNRKNQGLFILTADRGRGKSTLLGQFANQVSDHTLITVTAASKSQAKVLLDQLQSTTHNVLFIAPDEIIRQKLRISLLLIDEAAMLSVNILKQCIELSEKTLLTTTTGGYEGTGQGFLLKFISSLENNNFIHKEIDEPVRWGKQDHLELFLNETLLLKPYPPKLIDSNQQIQIQVVNKQQLVEDIGSLKAIYNLLVYAHYRTRPSDFRQLMDDNNQFVITASQNNVVVGVILLNQEGGFDETLCTEVFMGRRRPQGHLFAQMITAQAGIKNFAKFKGLRVQRITVYDPLRKQGIGRQLISRAETLCSELGFDYLSSSFAIDPTVTPFWKHLGFELVHIGSGKGKSTGRQTVAVIKTKKTDIHSCIEVLKLRINKYLPVWLLGYCSSIHWTDIVDIIEMINVDYPLTQQDMDEIHAVAMGFRGLELSQGSLQKFMINCVSKGTRNLEPFLLRLLIEKLILNFNWDQLSTLPNTNGKKQLTKLIRSSISGLL